MPIPNLIHPVIIEIEQLDKATTLYDDDYREPIQQSRRKAIKKCPAQISWGTDERLVMTAGGIELTSAGYLIFRYVDLIARSLTPQRDDRIVKMGHVETNVYLIASRPMGHYADTNGPSLVKWLFADRSPMKQGANP